MAGPGKNGYICGEGLPVAFSAPNFSHGNRLASKRNLYKYI
jgi:hypothetical protein